MKCYDCGAYTPPLRAVWVGACAVKRGVVHGNAYACDKWQRPSTHPVTCSWCNKPIPDTVAEVKDSDGMCAVCREKQRRELAELRRENHEN